MELTIVEKKDNPLLERTDVVFEVEHEGAKTPQRNAVRDKIAAETGGKSQAVIITRMRSRFGQTVTQGTAKVYPSVETAKKHERPYLLKRNGLDSQAEGEPKKDEAPKNEPESTEEEAKEGN